MNTNTDENRFALTRFANVAHSAGSVLPFWLNLNKEGKPHLFMNLGASVHSERGIDLYPLSEDGNIKMLEFGSLLAIRGDVNFITHEQKEKKA